MEINQLLLTMSYGDAIGNAALNIKRCLNRRGVRSEIYAQNIHPFFKDSVIPAKHIPLDSHVIYHMSIGCELSYRIPSFTGRRWMVYHNITPGRYYAKYDQELASFCEKGREELKFLMPHIHFALADSEYNRLELMQLGYLHHAVSPVIVAFDEYNRPPDHIMLYQLRSSKKRKDVLFVGRLVPNKRIEDVMEAFAFYRNYMEPGARLFLVGYAAFSAYVNELKQLIAEKGYEDVYIVGHVPFEQLKAYYLNADLFLCMSEHEGFCVPLLEAMYFNVPIIARAGGAVEETLGGAGLLVSNKNVRQIAALMHQVTEDEELRRNIMSRQKERLKYFTRENTENILWEHVKAYL